MFISWVFTGSRCWWWPKGNSGAVRFARRPQSISRALSRSAGTTGWKKVGRITASELSQDEETPELACYCPWKRTRCDENESNLIRKTEACVCD